MWFVDQYDLWSLGGSICEPSLFILTHGIGFFGVEFFLHILNSAEIEAEEARLPWLFIFLKFLSFLFLIRLNVFVRVEWIEVIARWDFLEFWVVWLAKWDKVSKLSGACGIGINLRIFSFGCEDVLEGHLNKQN